MVNLTAVVSDESVQAISNDESISADVLHTRIGRTRTRPLHEEIANGELPAENEIGSSKTSSPEDDREVVSPQSSSSGKSEKHLNPQDATLHSANLKHSNRPSVVAADFAVTVHDDNATKEISKSSPSGASSEHSTPRRPFSSEDLPSQKAKRRTPNHLMRRRNCRRSRIASIDTNGASAKGLPSPSNQYECMLVRRAILPIDPDAFNTPPEASQDDVDEAVYGDISLGLKLSISDTGHVIVQRVSALADGRASPAQLTGLIQRGDILLSIDNVSLTENALAGLTPLKAPDDRTVSCQRAYNLRFAAGEGMEMLYSIENRQTSAGGTQFTGNIATDMLALFPMVDQLSGMPLFDELLIPQQQSAENITLLAPPEMAISEHLSPRRKGAMHLDDHISATLATLRGIERRQYLGLDEQGQMYQHEAYSKPGQVLLTLPQRQELGRKAIVGASNLIKQIENIDAGKDIRSFQSWNSTLSLYSRASTRRRHVFDAASLPLKNFGRVDEGEKEDEDDDVSSVASGKSSTNSEQLDGDELLLRLAAHDEIWRKQVIEFLEKVAQESEDPAAPDDDKGQESSNNNIDDALSNELGNFLFGENMTKILAKHKTPRALPSEEVTAVLFDLATKLSASVPDEIKASGTILSTKSCLAPFTGQKRHAADSDVILAARFLLDGALPAWLKSFRPLAWEHRRILWPIDRLHVGSSLASSLSDDSLTVDTTNASIQSASTRQRKRKKNIQEIIEDQELDMETRGETYVGCSQLFTQSGVRF